VAVPAPPRTSRRTAEHHVHSAWSSPAVSPGLPGERAAFELHLLPATPRFVNGLEQRWAPDVRQTSRTTHLSNYGGRGNSLPQTSCSRTTASCRRGSVRSPRDRRARHQVRLHLLASTESAHAIDQTGLERAGIASRGAPAGGRSVVGAVFIGARNTRRPNRLPRSAGVPDSLTTPVTIGHNAIDWGAGPSSIGNHPALVPGDSRCTGGKADHVRPHGNFVFDQNVVGGNTRRRDREHTPSTGRSSWLPSWKSGPQLRLWTAGVHEPEGCREMVIQTMEAGERPRWRFACTNQPPRRLPSYPPATFLTLS